MPSISNKKTYPICITVSESRYPDPLHKGFDPEMVYVQCGVCGAPVIWEQGKTSELFRTAGIDPLELDPTCILVTNGCPSCSGHGMFSVQILRVTETPAQYYPVTLGCA